MQIRVTNFNKKKIADVLLYEPRYSSFSKRVSLAKVKRIEVEFGLFRVMFTLPKLLKELAAKLHGKLLASRARTLGWRGGRE